jgi:hypothetical protein
MVARLTCALCVLLAGCSSSDANVTSTNPSGDDAAVSDSPAADTLQDAVALEAAAPDSVSDEEGGGQTASCPVVGYAPCGGELAGVWNVLSLCPQDQAAADALLEHPNDNLPQCQRPDNPVVGVRTFQGTVDFGADGKVTNDISSSMAISYGFTDECLKAVKPSIAGAAAQCAALQNNVLTCAYAPGLCTCTGNVPYPEEKGTYDYQASGSDLEFAGEQTTYCVQGDRLVMDFAVHPISWRYWVLQRP